MGGRADIPEPWAAQLARKGLRQSIRGLADASGVAPTTISRMVRGVGIPDGDTLNAVARTLGITKAKVLQQANVDVALGPYEPPQEANRLTPKQREAVSAVIRAMVDGDSGRTWVDGEDKPVRAGNPAAKNRRRARQDDYTVAAMDVPARGRDEINAINRQVEEDPP